METKTFLRALLSTSAIVSLGLSTSHAQVTPSTDGVDDEIVVTGSRIKQSTFSSPVSIDVLNVEDAKLDGVADIGGLLQTTTAAFGSNQITSAVSTAFVADGGVGAESVGLRGLDAKRTLSLINGRRAGPSGVRGSVSAFDLNSIPLVGVDRVDILKDGASSVYGSDAIAGVVNYITRKGDGGEVDAYTQISEDGGGEEFRISGTYGKSFDRGHFRATADYFKENELTYADRSYLDCNEDYAFDPDTGARIDGIDPRTGSPNCNGTIWGQVWVYGASGGNSNIPANPRNRLLQFNYAGDNLDQFIPALPVVSRFDGAITPAGWFPVLYDQSHIDGMPAYAGVDVTNNLPNILTNTYSDFERQTSVTPDVERYTFMFDGEYELTDTVTAYGEALFNRRKNTIHGVRQYYSFIYGAEYTYGGQVYTTNTNPIAAGWGGANIFSPTPIAGGNDSTTEIDYMRFVGGLKGEFGENMILPGWDWDIYAQYSDSAGEYSTTEIYDDSITPYDLQTSSCNDIDFGNGLGVTAGSTNTDLGITVAGRPCVDVPWFDPEFLAGRMSQEVRDFLFTEVTGKTDFTTFSAEGFVTGDVMTLPAGKLQAAFGYFYQRDEITDTPSDLVLTGGAWQSDFAGITTGVQKTSAVYGELSIPLIKDKPFFEELSLTASGRFNAISSENEDGRKTSVDGTNYRLTGDWKMIPSFRLRGSYGTSFRAPALFEQFLADESSFSRQSALDPCIGWGDALAGGEINQTTANNCQADGIPIDYAGNPISASILRGGGFGNLEPETSENFTIGGVFSPDFADLSIALDYFDITVKDEIDTLTAGGIVRGCYASENFATEPLCNFYSREGANSITPFLITEARSSFININEQQNSGLDLVVRYGQETPIGDFDLNLGATYQLESKQLLLAEDTVEDTNGEVGEPKLTGFANITFDPGSNWRLRYNMTYVGATSNIKRFNRNNSSPTLDGQPAFFKNDTEVTIYHGLSGQYDFDNGITFRAGIDNIFDEHPPARSAADAGNTRIVSQYDLLGRRAFANVTWKFD